MSLLIPIVSAVLFRLGGWGKGDGFLPFIKEPTWGGSKWFRWLIGFVICAFYANWYLGVTYFVATSVLGYGENHWLRKLLGRDLCWLVYGLCFGLASFPVLGWWCLLQGLIASVGFWFLMKWSNDGMFPVESLNLFDKTGNGWKLSHPYVELGFGFLGTMMYWFK